MHVGILLTVEAIDVDEAVDIIERFNETSADWSDWNEAWGRWAEHFPDGAVRYSDSPDLFMSLIEQYHGFTMKGLNEDLKHVGAMTVWELAMLKENRFGGGLSDPTMLEPRRKLGKNGESGEAGRYMESDSWLNVHRARNILSLVEGQFSESQYFYDVTGYTPNTDALLKRAKNKPDEQWLLLWDYHY